MQAGEVTRHHVTSRRVQVSAVLYYCSTLVHSVCSQHLHPAPSLRAILSNPPALHNRPSSRDLVNSKVNLLNLSLGTLASKVARRSSNHSQVHLFLVNRTRVAVPLVFLARRQQLLVSHPPLQEERLPLEGARGIQETLFCQSQHLGVARPLPINLNSKERDRDHRYLDSSRNNSSNSHSNNNNRAPRLVVHYLGRLKIKHNNRKSFA